MRAFRFGIGTGRIETADEFYDAVRRAAAVGYDTLCVPDHLGVVSPEVGLMAAALSSERLRIGSFVFNNDFRHPAVLAQQMASLDVLSGGRLELGLGAGWNVPEYDASGIPYDRAGVRIARMEESLTILKRLFAGESVSFEGEYFTITDHTLAPLPTQGADLPILIGGNGDKVLRIAAREADIVGFTGFVMRGGSPVLNSITGEGIAERVDYVRREAGDRADDIELNALIQRVEITDDAEKAAAELVERWDMEGFEVEHAMASPFMYFGTVDEIADEVRTHRKNLGISYWVTGSQSGPDFAKVVEKLRGE